MNTPALDKILEHHARACHYWIFSGDRHCSCGRDEAIKELQVLKEQPKQFQLFPFPTNESGSIMNLSEAQIE